MIASAHAATGLAYVATSAGVDGLVLVATVIGFALGLFAGWLAGSAPHRRPIDWSHESDTPVAVGGGSMFAETRSRRPC